MTPASPCASRQRSTSLEDEKLYSVEVPGVPDIPGEGKPRRNPLVVNSEPPHTIDPCVNNLYDCFVFSCTKNAQRPFLGWRPVEDGILSTYHWLTYENALERVRNAASGLVGLGLAVNANVGLYSINRPEWLIAEQACFAQSIVTVPLYDTLGDDAIEFICGQTEMTVIFATEDKALNILRLNEKMRRIKTIIVMNEISDTLRQKAAQEEIQLIQFLELEQAGIDNPADCHPPKPEDLCTICYTSGTTGTPKGVMLPHSAMLSEIACVAKLCETHMLIDLNNSDVHLSYLPLAHVMERIVIAVLASVGAAIGFYQGDTLKLLDDIAELRPTFFVSVPRLFNRIYEKIMSSVKEKSAIQQYLFHCALSSKKKALSQGCLSHWLWDRLVFNKIKARLGGRVRGILTGSAPIAPEVLTFLRIAFGCEVYEGYGQTETCAGTSLTTRGDWTSGHIGAPLPSNEIKLVDVSEMSYTSKDQPFPRGEICVRGPNCFIGYYKDEEKTRETLDADGWVHSGDIGQWDQFGRLFVIDRKKNLFKLAQGEYIAPEKIEITLSKSPLISQAYVHGDSVKSALVAIIVPDGEALVKRMAHDSASEPQRSFAELCADPRVREILQKEIVGFSKKGTNELKGFEVPKAIYVEKEPFTLENGLLTATFKLKRFEAHSHYADHIEKLYVELGDQ